MEYVATESRAFKIVVFIFTGFVLGVTIANVVYFNRLRDSNNALVVNNNNNQAITTGEANVMFWVNMILAIIAGIIFLWSIYRLAFSQETRKRVRQYTLDPTYGSQQGYTYVPSTVSRTTTVSRQQPALTRQTVVRTDPTLSAQMVSVGQEQNLLQRTDPRGN